MYKIFLTSLIISLLTASQIFAAGSSDTGSSKTRTQYDMAVSHIKSAKELEKKGKVEKAKKKYEKAQKLLLKTNKQKPGNADTERRSAGDQDHLSLDAVLGIGILIQHYHWKQDLIKNLIFLARMLQLHYLYRQYC